MFAMARDFREASRLMKEANAIRSSIFGRFDPNELRERTQEYLASDPHQ